MDKQVDITAYVKQVKTANNLRVQYNWDKVISFEAFTLMCNAT